MLITRIELENIKNYDEGTFDFSAGVTAISGPNGAGKTTLLESIAWALFDQLPYKKEDFLRRGAKKGAVRVTFESAIDGRQYTVYRDTGSGYYIYDPRTKMRLVEQKGQVSQWIKQHIGVDPATDLKTLFTSTIGVPQGTFTVEFAEQPSKRKVSFDRVLRVDEYQKSSDELRSLLRLLESRDADLREEIARVEVEVSYLDSLIEERSRLEKEIGSLADNLRAAEQRRDQARVELDRLDEAKKTIDQLSREIAVAESKSIETERRRDTASEEVRRASVANEAVRLSAEGFAIYNEADHRLKSLEADAARRDAIKIKFAESEREFIRLESSLQSKTETLRQLESDRSELERLAPIVEEQSQLDGRLTELQRKIGELSILRERHGAAESELKSFRIDYANINRQIEETEQLREIAERSVKQEEERRELEISFRDMKVELERISERRRELRRASETIKKLAGEIQACESEIQAGAEAEHLAASLPEIEERDRALTEEIAALRSDIQREKKIMAGIKDGLCPLLNERCLNMKEGEGLDQYFQAQIGNESRRLAELERSRKEIQLQLKDGKAALKTASAVEAHRVQLFRYRQEIDIERNNAARLEAEIKESKVDDLSVRQSEQRLARIDAEIKESREARIKYEGLGLMKERLESLRNEGMRKRETLEEMKKRIEEMSSFPDELARVRERLSELDDPRGRCRNLKLGLEREPEIREAISALEAARKKLDDSMRSLSEHLEKFADLDRLILAERDRRSASEKDHRTYIENYPLASLLAARQSELKTIEAELTGYITTLVNLKHAFNLALSGYDEKSHASIKRELEELIDRAATFTSELNASTARLAEINQEIERLIEAKSHLQELSEQREKYSQLFGLSDFIRDVLKRAVPFITEAHLQSISIEANQLFREITGNPMTTLRWDAGYEITLEEDGHERPFASLSGGEQMAAALSVRLALLKELSDIRLAIFDEPTTNMDEERRRNLAEQIGRIKDFDQLFVISHDDTFEGFTDRVVHVHPPAERLEG